jgi:hypothetical protein
MRGFDPERLVLVGVAAGVAAVIIYPLRTFAPVPEFLGTALFLFFGPVLVVAFVGLYPAVARPATSVAAILGTVFGVLAGAINMMFAAVQLNNLFYIRRYASLATDPTVKETWRNILKGVFTVQNGLNYTMDFFLDWTIFMYAVVLWRWGRWSRLLSVLGLAAGGAHFVMKLVTFPEPPAEAGLFDAGPLVGAWFGLFTLHIGAGWLKRRRGARGVPVA